MYTNTSITVTVATSSTWYEVDANTPDFTTGELNLVTFTDHYLTVLKAGRYKIDFHVSASTSIKDQEISVTCGVNGTASETAHSHSIVVKANGASEMGGTTILSLAANDQVSLFTQNESAANDVTISHANLTLVQVGG